jgi:hypothetical protein
MEGLFHPDCPDCAQELGLNGVPPAPGKHRAVSDPAETNRKELTQCQFCYKSRAEGAVLQKCAGCKVDLYCVRCLDSSRLVSLLIFLGRARNAREKHGQPTNPNVN